MVIRLFLAATTKVTGRPSPTNRQLERDGAPTMTAVIRQYADRPVTVEEAMTKGRNNRRSKDEKLENKI